MLMPVEASGAIPLGILQPTVAVVVVDSKSQAEPDLVVLSQLFSLTRAEARIAGRLAMGRSVDEIAAEARLSVGTVRTHVKRIMSKTATVRQGELISLILRSVTSRRP